MLARQLTFLTIVITFLLLLLGGVVHNTESSLACPDWPLCFGQIMPEMKGGILIEHSHRLLASSVGLLTILILVAVGLQRKKCQQLLKVPSSSEVSCPPETLQLSILALILVIVQGVLGGLTVIYRLPTIVSTAHLSVSMLFFSTLVLLHHKLSEREKTLRVLTLPLRKNWNPHLRKGILTALCLVYGQMVLGAFMRHSGAGAACGLGPSFGMMCLDSQNTWERVWWPSNIMAQLHMVHRYFAIGVAFAVFYSCFCVIKHFMNYAHRHRKLYLGLMGQAMLPPFLVMAQVVLGILTVTSHIDVIPTTAHLGMAALLLVSLWKLNLNLGSLEKRMDLDKATFLFASLLELTKPKLSGLVMVTAAVGFLLAPGPFMFMKGIITMGLIFMVVAGTCVLNCYLEKEVDKKMVRTQGRPLPSGRLKDRDALIFGLSLILVSIPLLFILINPITAYLGALASFIYLCIYTPMKQKSTLALFIGAIPGALPPVMGLTAVTGTFDVMAIWLFLILFVWQLPHFMAISIYHVQDFNNANIKVFPTTHGVPKVKKIIFGHTILLTLIAVYPLFYFSDWGALHSSGKILAKYFSLFVGVVFLALALRGLAIGEQSVEKNKTWARHYFLASIIYLPSILGAMLFLK